MTEDFGNNGVLQAENEELKKRLKETEEKLIKTEGERNSVTSLNNQNQPHKTSFIFELLQNAEDALDKYEAKDDTVRFTLENNQLTLSHYGRPFNKKDVESICTACQSLKKNKIGKYGIGFKSVGKFTTSPQIFSGDKSFEIKDLYNYSPIAPLTDLAEGETRIILPFNKFDAEGKSEKQKAFEEIKEGLKELRGRDILFLPHIKTVKCQVGKDIFHIARKEEELDNFARRVITTSTNPRDEEKNWIVFSKGEDEKRVEIAFLQKLETTQDEWKLGECGEGKTLYCYLPLDSQHTGLKFLVQGAFETTPARTTLAQHPHNNDLIERAGDLLIEILFWLKSNKKLDWDIFNYLPIEGTFFDNPDDFSQIVQKLCTALSKKKLLPTNRGFIAAEHAKFPQNKELRELFNDTKISRLFRNEDLRWLKAGLSGDVREFLSKRLGIKTLNIFDLMKEKYVTKEFMKQQSDSWIQKLYAFLLDEIEYDFHFDELKTLPLIRLKNGKHISSHDSNGKPQVYLSSTRKHPNIIKPETIKTKEAKAFMEKLGIETHDDTDDLINEMQERYPQSDTHDFSLSKQKYNDDIKRIIAIQNNDKIDKEKKKKFSDELKHIRFVKAKNMKTGEMTWNCPEEVYIATENLNLETLFNGVDAYLVLDDDLNKDDIREMLIHYGANTCLKYIPVECHLSYEDLDEIYFANIPKSERGRLPNRRARSDKNHDIEYLDDILASLTPENKNKAEALWNALIKMPSMDEKSQARFAFVHDKKVYPPAKFIYTLNKEKWIPDPDGGELKTPDCFLFDDLGWESNKTLQDKICFKSDTTQQLQESAGLDNEHLEFAMEMQSIKNAINNDTATDEQKARYAEFESVKNKSPDDAPSEPMNETSEVLLEPTLVETTGESQRTISKGAVPIIDYNPIAPPRIPRGGGQSRGEGTTLRTTTSSSTPPLSSVSGGRGGGVANSEVEKSAIEAVRGQFPEFKDANHDTKNNPGFDLYEEDENGNRVRWVEVKGVSGAHDEIPTMTSTQFGFALGLNALGEGDKYIHITVAHALTAPQIYRTSDPAHKDKKTPRIDNSEETYSNEDDD